MLWHSAELLPVASDFLHQHTSE